MDLRKCYEKLGSKYEDVMGRLMKEERITKYLLKFVEADDYSNLNTAVEEKNWEIAFRMSHNLKGLCLNLGLEGLKNSSSELCEALRGGVPAGDIDSMLKRVKEDYEYTVSVIKESLADV